MDKHPVASLITRLPLQLSIVARIEALQISSLQRSHRRRFGPGQINVRDLYPRSMAYVDSIVNSTLSFASPEETQALYPSIFGYVNACLCAKKPLDESYLLIYWYMDQNWHVSTLLHSNIKLYLNSRSDILKIIEGSMSSFYDFIDTRICSNPDLVDILISFPQAFLFDRDNVNMIVRDGKDKGFTYLRYNVRLMHVMRQVLGLLAESYGALYTHKDQHELNKLHKYVEKLSNQFLESAKYFGDQVNLGEQNLPLMFREASMDEAHSKLLGQTWLMGVNQFMFLHELAHYALSHINIQNGAFDPRLEAEADSFAFDILSLDDREILGCPFSELALFAASLMFIILSYLTNDNTEAYSCRDRFFKVREIRKQKFGESTCRFDLVTALLVRATKTKTIVSDSEVSNILAESMTFWNRESNL